MEITKEFEGAEFGDGRLSERLVRIGTDLARSPAASIPAACQTEAASEATYRFLRNESVTPEAILKPHVQQTRARAQRIDRVVVAHDTTEFGFSTDREGLGRVGNEKSNKAFFSHVSLAISGDGDRLPLGIVGEQRFVRTKKPTRKKSHHSEKKPESQRESRRWWQQVQRTSEVLDDCETVIHVCDREADDYLTFARCVDAGIRFVIRAQHDRKVECEEGSSTTLRRVLEKVDPVLCRAVQLTPRAATLSWVSTSKKSRVAKLEFRAATVEIRRPDRNPSSRFKPPEWLTLQIVHVREIDPPVGFESVDWLLVTTEPIDTPEQVEAIVDTYDTRWVIEEYFKALKTGCSAEKRQLASATTIFNAIAILMPIAYQLLALKHRAASSPASPAHESIPRLHLQLLTAHPKVRLCPAPTVEQAWLAIARLGGHLRSNGRPGWQVIWRGMLLLLALVEGAELAAALANPATCDQS